MFKVSPDGALGSLIWWDVSLLMAGAGTGWALRILLPTQIILWFYYLWVIFQCDVLSLILFEFYVFLFLEPLFFLELYSSIPWETRHWIYFKLENKLDLKIFSLGYLPWVWGLRVISFHKRIIFYAIKINVTVFGENTLLNAPKTLRWYNSPSKIVIDLDRRVICRDRVSSAGNSPRVM